MYCDPEFVCTGAGPHRSECISPRKQLALPVCELGNDALVNFLTAQDGHCGGAKLMSVIVSDRPFTIFFCTSVHIES